jgi:hypothetical protein
LFCHGTARAQILPYRGSGRKLFPGSGKIASILHPDSIMVGFKPTSSQALQAGWKEAVKRLLFLLI